MVSGDACLHDFLKPRAPLQVEGTTSNLNAIEAKLIRTVSIYARGYSSSATTTVAEIDLSAGMDLSQDSEGNEETPEEHIQHFIVPEDCAPSVSIGRMLSISYSVVIHADGGCCVQGPRICLPVEVVRCSAIPSSAWGGIKGQSSECGISTPEGFSPNPALKGSPQEVTKAIPVVFPGLKTFPSILWVQLFGNERICGTCCRSCH